MKLNERTIIEGDSVYLVPYEEHHVERYHEWMKSPELQKLTASEPLTLEEEFQMQKSWRQDDDIKFDETGSEIESMVGDTNIFLKDDGSVGEIEIMIAETSARGQGLGKEALLLMMYYGIINLNIKLYRAIILSENSKSISLFESLSFKMVRENKIFNEIVYEKEVTNSWKDWIRLNVAYKQKER